MKQQKSFGPAVAAAVLLLAAVACGGGGSPTSSTGVSVVPPAPAATPTPAPAFSLAGRWERFDSSFSELDGMIVEVDAGEARGIIVSTPDNRYRFGAGDLKWSNLARTGSSGEYRFDDLVRQSGSGNPSYIAGVLRAQGQGQVDATFPSSGTVQHWRRK